MSARARILERIRSQPLPAAPLPATTLDGITFELPEKQFADTLKFVGGEALVVPEVRQLDFELRRLPCVEQARQIVCLVPGVGLGNLDLDSVATPHDLAGVDVAIVPGEFAVAENGAVWVSGARLHHRAICFLAQHLVLVVPRRELVPHMHAAYQRLSFDQPGYGVFISGPSKTADIEQSLVIGAHGARSLAVLLVGEGEERMSNVECRMTS